MKKFMSIAVVLLVCATLCLPGCEQNGGASQPPTQEEVQQELVEILDDMRVLLKTEQYKDITIPLGITDEGEEIRIFGEYLKVKLHLYELDKKTQAPTFEEVIGVYAQYDEYIYIRLKDVHEWYKYWDGDTKSDIYNTALMFDSNSIYKENTGTDYFEDNKPWSEVTAQEKFGMEEYIRNNPDFSEGRSNEYKQLLVWLEIENPDDSSTSSATVGAGASVAESGSTAA